MTKVIAMTAPAAAGKDLVADLMMSQMILRVPSVSMRTLSFAAPIKEAVASILGCKASDFTDRKIKEVSLLESHGIDASPRVLMQTLGSNWARDMIDEEFWIRIAQSRLETMKAQGVDYVFITDLRFDNEAEFVKANGGTILHIHRPDVAPVASHASENGINVEPCFTIDNSSTIDDLRLRIAEMVPLLQTVPMQRVSIDDCSPQEWNSLRGAF